MRRVSLLLLAALVLAGPAVADVYTINPFDPQPPAKIALPPDEAALQAPERRLPGSGRSQP
jgi:hypothetical protein